jgi:hypothetical protein
MQHAKLRVAVQKLIKEGGIIKPDDCAELEKRAGLLTRFVLIRTQCLKFATTLNVHQTNFSSIHCWHNFYLIGMQ